jgi:hypothetical protein
VCMSVIRHVLLVCSNVSSFGDVGISGHLKQFFFNELVLGCVGGSVLDGLVCK